MSGYRPRGAETWRVEDQGDGTFDVYLGRTRKKSGIEYVDALRYVRGLFKPDQQVFTIEVDGYRTNVTRSISRRTS